MTRRSALAALTVLGAGCAASSARGRMPQEAPDFELPSLGGGRVRLSRFRGRPVVLNFWATWCAPCRIETPWLVGLYAAYRARRVEFLGVSLDEPGERRAVVDFATSMGVTYPVLLGTRSVADAYGGVRLMPQTFFISGAGAIAYSTIGITTRDDIEAAIRRVSGR